MVQSRISRQKEIDTSIANKAEYEYLYDRPYEDKARVRVAGPFTVESVSPHRTMIVDENHALKDPLAKAAEYDTGREAADFAQMVLDNLKTAGVQQAEKTGKINFNSVKPWPGEYIAAEATILKAAKTNVLVSSSGQSSVQFHAPTLSQPRVKPLNRASMYSSAVLSTMKRTPPSSTNSARFPC
jgi:hypothetical protein